MNDCFSRGGCNEKHAMELTLIESTMLMCKDPAIFLQYSFSLIYVVLILIFWITWVCLIHDNFYLPFLRNYCLLVLRSSFKMFYTSNPPVNRRLFTPFSLPKLLICLVPFAINSSCTVAINSALRLISLNVRGLIRSEG